MPICGLRNMSDQQTNKHVGYKVYTCSDSNLAAQIRPTQIQTQICLTTTFAGLRLSLRR